MEDALPKLHSLLRMDSLWVGVMKISVDLSQASEDTQRNGTRGKESAVLRAVQCLRRFVRTVFGSKRAGW